jgi:syndecan 4
MCSACPPTFTRTESGSCSLYCSGGQVIFGTDTTATCVACDDPRILAQTAGTVALGVVNGRCQATSCKPGYGLGLGISPTGYGAINTGTGCEPCQSGAYSLGGPTSCTSCAAGARSANQATSCTCSPGYSYGSASLTPSGKECAACTGSTYGLGGSQQCMQCAAGSTGASNSLPQASGQTANTFCRCSAGYSGMNIPASGAGCTVCSGNTYSTPGASQCTACASNTTPTDDHSACYCSAGYGLTGGSCVECSLDTVNPGGTVNNQVCLPCDAPLKPTWGQTGCSLPATMKARAKARRSASEADRIVAARQYKYPIVR